MNFCDRISNQATINYLQGKYGRQLSNRHSSPDLRPAKKQTESKEFTKSWVVRTFYSNRAQTAKINPTAVACAEPSAVASSKPSAAATGDQQKSSSARKIPDNLRTVSSLDQVSSNNPKSAVYFDQSLIDSHAEKFKFCLVGKFPEWRPSLAQIRQWVSAKWKLQGCWSVTLLDHRHVFIKLDNEADMLYVWTKNRWLVDGHWMKVFKWLPTFRPSDGEPSSAAVWISLPTLPLIFFEEELLFRVAALVGRVLAMDISTRSLSRPNVARVCVEVDLLKELPRQVWIGIGDEWGHSQELLYEKLPSYCTECRQQGHSTQLCSASATATTSHEDKKVAFRNPCSQVELTQDWAQHSSQIFSKGKRFEFCSIIQEKSEKVCNSPETPLELSGHSSTETEEDVSEKAAGGVLNPDVPGKDIESPPESEKEDNNDSARAGKLRSVKNTGRYPIGYKQAFSNQPGRGESFLEAAHPITSPRRRKTMRFWGTKQKSTNQVVQHIQRVDGAVQYDYSSIIKMTNNFSEKLGEGGFGPVYKGLCDGQNVAVKVLGRSSEQGDREFNTEGDTIPYARHIHVIRLLGFCSEGANRALVYEFMPNGSLDWLICSQPSRVVPAETFLDIAVGIARGLDYLHNGCRFPVVCSDVKPSNILLDEDFCPKISDFGLSMRRTRSWSSESVSDVNGTRGYLAPEVVCSGRISKKTDVYGYGVTLLEMALKKRPVLADDFSQDWRFVHCEANRVLRGEISGVAVEEAERKMLMVGLRCTQADPLDRPSFAEVIDLLGRSAQELSVVASNSSAALPGAPLLDAPKPATGTPPRSSPLS